MSVAWELVATFTEVELSAGMVAASVTFASALVGYLKRERVLK